MIFKVKFAALLCLSGIIGASNISYVSTAAAETFQEALEAAYDHPLLLAERARVREIDETYIQARAAGRLTSSLAGSLGVEAISASSLDFSTGSYIDGDVTIVPRNVQLEVIQPLYQGGRVRALKRQSRAGILAARETLRDTEQSIFEQTATAYVDVLRSEEQARIRRNNVVVLGRQLTAAKDRFEAGVGTLTDIAQSESRLAGADIGLANADADLLSHRASYVQLTGHMPVDLRAAPVIIVPPTLEAALDLAMQNNPSIIAAQFGQRAADAGLQLAKSSSRPTIGLVGALTGSADPSFSVNRANSATLTASISIPIFTGGLNRSSKREASEAKSRAIYEARNTQRLVQQSVTQLWARMEAARRTREASQKQVEAAKIAFDGVVLEQSVGTRTTLDVLDSEQELLTARLSVIEARRNFNVTTYSLLRVIGVFDAAGLNLTMDRYDPSRNLFLAGDERKTSGAVIPESYDEDAGKAQRLQESGEALYDRFIADPLEILED